MSEGEEQLLPEQNAERWGYDSHFREYLLLLGNKGIDALESMTNYPKRIELDKAWHETHLKMRDETSNDHKERFALVGFREDRSLALQVKSATGTEQDVQMHVIYGEVHKAKSKYGIANLLGDIHTHPRNSPFSVTDLFSLLYEHFGPEIAKRLPKDQLPRPHFFSGLVTPEEVIYAFKSKETFPVRPSDMFPKDPFEFFAKYWYEKSGFEYKGRNKVRKVRPEANHWDVNLGIARTHNLVLYKGHPNEDLRRTYPE